MDANDRKRIRREIMKNAALLFGCDYPLVSVVTERKGEEEDSGWLAIARGPAGERLAIKGDDDEGALVALLNEVIDRANGVPTLVSTMEKTPGLEAAAALLQRSRLELIEDIRKELDENPIADDKKL